MATIEERLAAVEEEVARLRLDSADTRLLAAKADHDVAEFRDSLRAQVSVLNALRETQVEQGQQIGGLRADVTTLQDHVSALRTEMVARFDQVHGGLEQIVGMLNNLTGGQSDTE